MTARAWLGPEREGEESKGERTLFVEADALDDEDIRRIAAAADREGARRIYLGANRKDVNLAATGGALRELARRFAVVVETSAERARRALPLLSFARVIVRIDTAPFGEGCGTCERSQIRLKIDDGAAACGVSGPLCFNSLASLHDGKSTDDTEVRI